MPFSVLKVFKGLQRLEPALWLSAVLIWRSFLRNKLRENVCGSFGRPPTWPAITVTPDLQDQAFALPTEFALLVRIGGPFCRVHDLGNPMGKPTRKRVA